MLEIIVLGQAMNYVTNFSKKYNIDPQVVVAGLSITGGLIHTYMTGEFSSIWEFLRYAGYNAGAILGASQVIYNYLMKNKKLKNDDK